VSCWVFFDRECNTVWARAIIGPERNKAFTQTTRAGEQINDGNHESAGYQAEPRLGDLSVLQIFRGLQ
jgi:hypothetical protein